MKIRYNILAVLLVFLAASCSNSLEENVKFDVNAVVGNEMQTENITVKKSQPITFEFNGNPDFITFYSGESGKDYSMKDKTESSKEDITTRLEFTAVAQYGNSEGIFKVFLSTDFSGLTKDPKKDLQNIKSNNWIDISDRCELPITPNAGKPNQIKLSSIALDEYLDKDITIGFLYKPYHQKGAQSTYEITDLKIINTDKKSGEESEFLATSMGFTPFDVKELDKEDGKPYQAAKSRGEHGVWFLGGLTESPSMLRIQSSPVPADGVSFNEDWLISVPLKLNSRTPDKGVSIKTIHTYLNQYEYRYDVPGEYNVTFIARNSNIDHHSEIIKQFKVTVIE
mgnify:FL=1